MNRINEHNALSVLVRTMTEAQLQQALTEMADVYRVKWHHEVDSRRSKAGLPDLILCGSHLELWELKKQSGKVSPDQRAWLEALMQAGITARVVRPIDLVSGRCQDWMKGLKP